MIPEADANYKFLFQIPSGHSKMVKRSPSKTHGGYKIGGSNDRPTQVDLDFPWVENVHTQFTTKKCLVFILNVLMVAWLHGWEPHNHRGLEP